MSSPTPPPIVTNPIQPTVIGAYENAWRALLRSFWPMVGAVLVTVIAQVPANALNMIGAALETRVHGVEWVTMLLAYAWLFFGVMPLQFGMFRMAAAAARSERVEFSDLAWAFTSPRNYVRAIGGILAVMAAVTAAMAPALLVLLAFGCGAGLAAARQSGGNPSAELATLLGALGLLAIFTAFVAMLPGLWVALRLLFAQFLIPDAEMGPIDAITSSWAMTRGHSLTLIGVALLVVPLMMAGCAAFCVGIFVAQAMAWLAFASLYAALGGRRGVPPGIV